LASIWIATFSKEAQAIDVDGSIRMDDILGDDIVYESHSTDESGSDFEDDIDWQKEGYTNVVELFHVPDEKNWMRYLQ
jgi:hypothetical protein